MLVRAGLAAAVSGLVMARSGGLPRTRHDADVAPAGLRHADGGGAGAGPRRDPARNVRPHQRWTARSYAVAQGAGTQALVLGPMVLFVDQPGGGLKAAGMGFAWVLNLAVAEWLVRRSQARQSSRRVS